MEDKDFVTYEQAYSLKKLGFDEWCIYHYNINGDLKSNECDAKERIDVSYLECCKNNWINSTDIDAPTLAQAQKWLLKNKGIYVDAVYDCIQYTKNQWVAVWDDINDNKRSGSIEGNFFTSPEEALSAAITECLKLLEK